MTQCRDEKATATQRHCAPPQPYTERQGSKTGQHLTRKVLLTPMRVDKTGAESCCLEIKQSARDMTKACRGVQGCRSRCRGCLTLSVRASAARRSCCICLVASRCDPQLGALMQSSAVTLLAQITNTTTSKPLVPRPSLLESSFSQKQTRPHFTST